MELNDKEINIGYEALAILVDHFQEDPKFQEELKKRNIKIIPNKLSELITKLEGAGFKITRMKVDNKESTQKKQNPFIDFNILIQEFKKEAPELVQFYSVANKNMINSETLVLGFTQNHSYHMNQLIKGNGKNILEGIIQNSFGKVITVKLKKI